jgi:hypothetical protein
MTRKQKNDVPTGNPTIAARRAKVLAELRKVTLAELHPDPEYRAAAEEAFHAALNEKPSP